MRIIQLNDQKSYLRANLPMEQEQGQRHCPQTSNYDIGLTWTIKELKKTQHTIASIVRSGELQTDITAISEPFLIHFYQLFIPQPHLLHN